MTKDTKVTPTDDSQPRKTYASPRLVIYGNITEITRSVGTSGKGDGKAGSAGMDKSGA